MIDPKELRIGNYIASGKEFTNLSIIGKVLEIGNVEREFEQVYCECEESFEWFFRDDYCGIPITEEWLIKLGFNEVDPVFNEQIEHAYEIPSWGRVCIMDGKLVSEEYYFLDGMNAEIKYVHQLQNLYFALTSQELTIQ